MTPHPNAHPRVRRNFMPFNASVTPLLLALCAAYPAIAVAQTTTSAEQRLKEVRITEGSGGSFKEEEASSATKFSAPLKDIPVAIQVIPRQVMDDQAAFRPHEIVQNVSGVYRGNANFGDNFIFRGFAVSSEYLRDGYPDRRESMRDTANIEQIEVLKGPASVLFGRVEPGGTLNYVTKQPLFVPRYATGLSVDSHGLTRPTFDVSTVSDDRKVGIRLNGAFEHGGNFRDASFSDRQFLSGVVTWRPTTETQVSMELETLNDRRLFDRGIPNLGRLPAPIPVTTFLGEPSDYRKVEETLLGYTINHKLNSEWRVKHALRASYTKDADQRTQFLTPVAADGSIKRDRRERWSAETQITSQLELYGDVRLGGTRHQTLLGLDWDRQRTPFFLRQANTTPASNSVNIYNPVIGNFVTAGAFRTTTDSLSVLQTTALYAQDLIDIAPQWKALLGVRSDATSNRSDNRLTASDTTARTQSLSPRAGVVWQPASNVSIYSSYSESFLPVTGTTFAGDMFKPTQGKQLEVGAKSDWFDGKLSATVAAYQIKKTNVVVTDSAHTGYSVQAGEVTSKGVELDVSGTPLPGLSVVGNLSLNTARVTQDTRATVLGRRLQNVPDKGAGLWASYELQSEALRGWGGGLGTRYVGEREGAEVDSFVLPSYTRWDASVWYRSKKWRVTLKVDNLANKVYFESALAAQGIYPGTTRTVSLNSSFEF